MEMEVRWCGDRWGWKTYLKGMDITGVVIDGDGLISHYRTGL